jgi:hypothetical protein
MPAPTEGILSRRDAEARRARILFLRDSASPREIFSSPRGKWLNPHEPTDFPLPNVNDVVP